MGLDLEIHTHVLSFSLSCSLSLSHSLFSSLSLFSHTRSRHTLPFSSFSLFFLSLLVPALSFLSFLYSHSQYGRHTTSVHLCLSLSLFLSLSFLILDLENTHTFSLHLSSFSLSLSLSLPLS